METWNRKNFDLEKLKGKKVAIRCNTEEKAKDLLNILDELGITWFNNKSLNNHTYWGTYEYLTCYDLLCYQGMKFANVDYYLKERYEIVDWEIVDETEESKPELLKFEDLEEGKIYNIVEPMLYKKENGNLKFYSNFIEKWVVVCCNSEARFIDTGKTEIKEKEVDFDKVPQGVLVQVRNCNGIWKNRYFVKMHEGKYVASTRVEDDKYTVLTILDDSLEWDCCRIHPDVEIPSEWYKED